METISRVHFLWRFYSKIDLDTVFIEKAVNQINRQSQNLFTLKST